jgi:hypothetical protein
MGVSAWMCPLHLTANPSTIRCAITNFSFHVEPAHIIPKEETDWFNYNGMAGYDENACDTQFPENLIKLRTDIQLVTGAVQFRSYCVISISPRQRSGLFLSWVNGSRCG